MAPEAKHVEIRIDFTPNPNALKYILDENVLLERGSASFQNAAAAESSPLAKRLLAVPGIVACMIGYNFVSVTRTENGDWEVIDLKVREALKAHVHSGEPAVNALSLEAKSSANANDPDVVKRIKDVLDKHIRPAVAMDGGDVIFDSFENGTVFLYMQGSCAGCPSSTATLKMGIETKLRSSVPEVNEVVAL